MRICIVRRYRSFIELADAVAATASAILVILYAIDEVVVFAFGAHTPSLAPRNAQQQFNARSTNGLRRAEERLAAESNQRQAK